MKKRDESILDFTPETLESRQMLAGNVTATVAGGSLSVSGDGQDNFVVLGQYNDQLAVIGINTDVADADFSDSFFGTEISVKLLDGVTRDVNVLLRGGDDTFLMGASVQEWIDDDADVSAALVASGFSIESLQLSRDVKIWTHGGRDTVVVAGTEIGRNLIIDTGFGLEDTVIVGGGGIAHAALEFLSDGSDSLWDGLESSIAGLTGGELGGDALFDIASVIFGEVTVGNNMTILGESSRDTVYVGGVDIGRDALINTNVSDDTIYFGVGADVDVFVPWFDDGDGGRVSLDGGGGLGGILSEIRLSGHVNVGRRATINAGDGDDLTRIGGAIQYAIELPDVIGPAEALVEEGGFTYQLRMGGGVDVGQDLIVTAGNNDDETYIAVVPVSVDTVFPIPGPEVQALAVNGIVDKLDANVQVGRNMLIDMGGDDDFLKIGGSEGEVGELPDGYVYNTKIGQALGVKGNLTVLTGAGTDEVEMGQQEPIFVFLFETTLALEESESGQYQIDVGKNLVLNTGWHDDSVSIAGHAYIYEYEDGDFGSRDNLGTLRVGNNMRVNTDKANDTFEMGLTSSHSIEGFGIATSSSAIDIGRDLFLITGDQDDTVAMDSTSVGDDVSINTGWGRDSVDIGGGYGDYSFSVDIGDRLTIQTSLERDTVNIVGAYIGGSATILTGLRDDSVYMHSVIIGGNLVVNTDRGLDTVELDYVFVNKNVTVNTGAEADEVHIMESSGSRLSVSTADGDDYVCIIDSSYSSARLNGGSGDFDALDHNLSITPTEIGFELDADCIDDDDDEPGPV